MIAESIAGVITDSRAAREERRRVHDWMLELLARPFSAAEAAAKLGVSKPTAIKWLRAGLLRHSEDTSEAENLFDAASVLATREILQKLKMTGTVAERAQVIAELPERLYWGANPGELDSLMTSLREASSGKFVDVSDAELERGRALLEKRRALRRQRAGRRKRQKRSTSGRSG
jgi:DNA-binding transcriptional MerR regulator